MAYCPYRLISHKDLISMCFNERQKKYFREIFTKKIYNYILHKTSDVPLKKCYLIEIFYKRIFICFKKISCVKSKKLVEK